MLSGNFKVGQDSHNPQQTKVLARDIDSRILTNIYAYIMRAFPRDGFIHMSRHLVAKTRRERLSIDFGAIRDTIWGGASNVIEVSRLDRWRTTHMRVLMRDYGIRRQVRIDGRITACNACFVLDLTTQELVTFYWNEATDRHATLNPYHYERVES